MTIKELENSPKYYFHHTATRRGYESRRGGGSVEPYSGRFGKGFVAVYPRWDTSIYVTIAYYIERGAGK